MKNLHVRLPHLHQAEAVDELDDLLESGLHDLRVAADDAEAQERALPKLLAAALRNGDVELVGYPRLDPLEHAPFPFQGMVLGKDQAKSKNPHDKV